MKKDEKFEVNLQQPEQCRNYFQYIAAISASLATLSTGLIVSWPSQITDELLAGALGFPMTADELGWVCSVTALGAALLALVIGTMCDWIGRKTTMLLLLLPLEIGWLLVVFAGDVVVLICGRFLTGMVAGAFCVTVPLYIDEIARKEIRGQLGGLTQQMFSCGILLANILGGLLTITTFNIICTALPILFVAAFVGMPETPIYLLKKKRSEDSKKALERLLGKTCVETEINEMQKVLEAESKTVTLRDVWRKRSVKRACVIGFGLAMLKVFCGLDAISSYLSHIFGNTNTSLGPKNAAILFGVFQVLTSIPQALTVDRWGRKILLIVSQITMTLCLCSTGLSLHFKDHSSSAVLQYVPIFSLCLFIVAFALGIGPIGWMLTAEIFEDKIKSRAMSACTFLVWFLAFSSIKLFSVIENNWSISIAFFIYCGMSFVGTFFILLLVPETKGKSFTEIEELLSS